MCDSQNSLSGSGPSSLSPSLSGDTTTFGNILTPRPENCQGAEFNRDSDIFRDWKVGVRYELKRILGHGSYGEVVEAFDKRYVSFQVICSKLYAPIYIIQFHLGQKQKLLSNG